MDMSSSKLGSEKQTRKKTIKEKGNSKIKEHISDYESQRLERIEQNKKRMEAMGLRILANSLMRPVQKIQKMSNENKSKKIAVEEDEEYNPSQGDDEKSSSSEEDNVEISTPKRRGHTMTRHVSTTTFASGTQPPQEANMQPPNSESAPRIAPTKKQGRGKAMGHDIASKVAREGRRRIRFSYQNKTWNAIGDYASAYDSAVGMHTRDIVPPIYNEWKDVPSNLKILIQERLLEWFDIDYDYDDGRYRRVVDRDAAGLYSEWKTRLYKHFNKKGGIGDPQTARSNPPPHFPDHSLWGPACDLFMSKEWQDKSNRNKRNRAGLKYVSYHGRICYDQYREKKKNKETHEPQPHIENWKDMHMQGTTWANPQAEADYHQLKLKSTQLASSSTQTPIDETSIMEGVFGRRRGHMTGVGPKLANASSQPVSTSTMPPTQDVEEMRRMRDQVSQMYSLMRDAMAKYAPDIQLVMPTIVPTLSTNSSRVPSNDNEVDDDLLANSLGED